MYGQKCVGTVYTLSIHLCVGLGQLLMESSSFKEGTVCDPIQRFCNELEYWL